MTVIIDHEYHGILIATYPDEVYNWLHDKMGMSGDRWFIRPQIDGTMIYFKNERDHLLFLLAWGK
jgi:hypothetical protein